MLVGVYFQFRRIDSPDIHMMARSLWGELIKRNSTIPFGESVITLAGNHDLKVIVAHGYCGFDINPREISTPLLGVKKMM
jgi:hypothetical protein